MFTAVPHEHPALQQIAWEVQTQAEYQRRMNVLVAEWDKAHQPGAKALQPQEQDNDR